MSFSDFFKNIFGFQRSNRPPWEDRDDDDFQDSFGAFGFHGHGDDDDTFFRDPKQGFFGDADEMFTHFERHFQDMFKNFGFASFPSTNFPPIGEPDRRQEGDSSLRDGMLKPEEREKQIPGSSENHSPFFKQWGWNWPYSMPGSRLPPTNDKRDRDLDDEVSSGSLDIILPDVHEDREVQPIMPERKSFFRSVSVQRVVKPDGSVEERRTVKDEHGNVETTVTKTEGDRRQPDLPMLMPDSRNIPRNDRIQEPLIPDGSKSIFEKLFGPR